MLLSFIARTHFSITATFEASDLLALGGLCGIGRLNCQVCHRLICSMDGGEIIFVVGIVSNCSHRIFADADAFRISFCAVHEAFIDTEGSLLAKVTLK